MKYLFFFLKNASILSLLYSVLCSLNLNSQTNKYINNQNSLEVYLGLCNSAINLFNYLNVQDRKCLNFLFPDNCSTPEKININSLKDIYSHSGETYSDLGDEYHCKERFFLFYYNLYSNNSLLNFTNNNINSHFYTGACLPRSCDNLINEIFSNNTIKEKFNDYLNSNFYINNIEYVLHNKSNKSDNPSALNLRHKNSFKCIAIILLIYIGIKIIFSFIYYIFLKDHDELNEDSEEKDKRKKKKKLLKELKKEMDDKEIQGFDREYQLSDKDEKILEDNFFETKNEDLDNDDSKNLNIGEGNKIFSKKLIDADYLINKKDKKSVFIIKKVIRDLSIIHDIKILLTKYNKFYDSTNLNVAHFMQSILLFLMIYNNNLSTEIKLTITDHFNKSFYTSLKFSSIKFSSFSTMCYCALEGFIMVFKLLFYIKRLKQNSKKVNNFFFYFILLCIPKIVNFFAVFILVHMFLPNFINLYYKVKQDKNNSWNQLFLTTFISPQCESKIKYLFIPFYLAYTGDNEFEKCYPFAYILINEFYSYIIFLVLFLLIINIKRKIFERLIFLVVFVGFFLSLFTYNFFGPFKYNEIFKKYDNKFSYRNITGNILILKKTHMFITVYFMGIFLGIFYFYYIDIMSNKPLSYCDYAPFSFIKFLLMKINTKKTSVKRTLFVLFLLIQIFMSFIFIIVRGKKEINFDMDLKYLHYEAMEKQIYFIFFCLMMMFMVLLPKYGIIKRISDFKIFYFISRNSFSVFASIDYLVYAAYIIYDFRYNLNYSNFIGVSFGLFVFIMFISIIITCLFEIPIRVLIKEIFKKDEKSELRETLTSRNSSYYINNNFSFS